ncbi:6-bladed beta-propeller [Echinicola salinicaeni]|uniref:6-bladed beta-propeller n=1 Tax=Echinicola salinicaeni TaxID=2762757 RepID=UPI001C98DC8B|nr:6-bladed beta-propeller [Echinicola salinicaeni]
MKVLKPEENPRAKLSEMFEGIQYKLIDLPDSVYIGKVDKFLVNDQNMILGDFYQSAQVMVLDAEGNYKVSIKHLGGGPGEYIEINDVSLNPENNTIDILSPNKIIRFDMEGRFIEEFFLPLRVYKFLSLGENEFLFYVPSNMAKELVDDQFSDYSLLKWNLEEITPIFEDRVNNDNIPFFAERDVLKVVDGEILFSMTFCDTIYSLKDLEYKKAFALDFGNKKYPLEDFEKYGVDNILNDPAYRENYAYHRPNIHYDGRRLVTSYRYEGVKKTMIYDQLKDTIYAGVFFENDIDLGLPYLAIKGLYNNKIFTLHQPEEFLNHFNGLSDRNQKVDDNFLRIVDDISEQTAIVMGVYNLK